VIVNQTRRIDIIECPLDEIAGLSAKAILQAFGLLGERTGDMMKRAH
jgi:hypothetical protein